ncbi:T9SS type A sorting domain-containing protein [Winogradskyella algicola]|uniref:T9SS type A sorting domain-containing protein n=1 Tax=Winogradskyella algicola TaxID=2575815 RepID=UPI0011083244|nr:T9SS type A sorting domain-containing protein [Winogradskyella algicola]
MRQFYIFISFLFCALTSFAQVTYNGNGNSGFGGAVGGSNMTITDNGTNITITFNRGSGTFDNEMVIYIDSRTGGFSSTVDFADPDNGDKLRRAINGAGTFGGATRSVVNFPSGMEPDFAVAVNTSFGGLWELVNNASFPFIAGVGNPTSNTQASFSMSFAKTDIGIGVGDAIEFTFVVTYLDGFGGGGVFRSDEGYGNGLPVGNPGTSDVTFTSSELYRESTTYTYNGSWTPSDPNGSSTPNDEFLIASDNAIISTNTDSRLVTINPGASLTINSGANLNVADVLTLESVSTSYSSLIPEGTITGAVVYNRHVNNNGPINGNDLISAPLSGQQFNTFIGNNTNILANPSGTDVLFGGFDNDNATEPYELWDETDTTPLTAGVGYRSGIDPVAGSNLVSFEGTVNTGLVQVPIAQGSASILNLVGNPFPSYLDAQAFLTQNAAVLDPSAVVIYGYNDSTNGTSADDYTIISAIENNTLNIAPGQGFFVASNVVGGNLQFTTSTPDMRIISTDDDFIAGRSAISNVNINLSNATDNFITKVYFTASSGLGLDPGYDASLLGGVAPAFSLFSHLVEENMDVPFATQAIGKTDYNDTTIALGVNANMGEQLTFSIAENTMPASIEVYLDDTLTSTSTLLNAADYVLTPSEDLNGTGRFYLRFSNSALSTADSIFDGISIYGNQTNKTISIAGQLTEGTSANVYDIQGRLVTARPLVSDSTLQTIDASNLHTGVYIVKLVNGNAVKTQKIILK